MLLLNEPKIQVKLGEIYLRQINKIPGENLRERICNSKGGFATDSKSEEEKDTCGVLV